LKFDSVAKACGVSESFGPCGLAWIVRSPPASLLIADAFMQNHPDQLTETMRNCPDGFVVAETRNETTVDEIEDASFTFDGSIGSCVQIDGFCGLAMLPLAIAILLVSQRAAQSMNG
jgi:hypothetical protein